MLDHGTAPMAPRTMDCAEFEAGLADLCGGFRVEPGAAGRRMRATLGRSAGCGFEIAHVGCAAQAVHRGAAEIRADAGRNVFVIVQQEGRALMAQGDVARMLHPGDAVLIDSAAPAVFTFFGRYQRQMALHLDRSEALARFGSTLAGGRVFAAQAPLNQALRATLAQGIAAPHLPLGEVVFGLLAALLLDQAGAAQGAGLDPLARARQFIAAHLDDEALAPETIAAAARVSLRQLQRLFHDSGATPMGHVREMRLARAAEMLAGADPAAPIARIALAAGFSDLSHFNRAFRTAFGCTPRDYRAARAGQGAA